MKTRMMMAAMLSAAVLGTVATTAAATDAPEGYVTFFADKAVIGQGLVTEPVLVPYYDGDNGIDIVKRAADVLVVDGEWGSYIDGFADTDTGADIPEQIAAVCPEMSGRNTDGYLCALDYTAQSGWNWFINDENASVGISDYVPTDGDVIQFRFTVYGYGCDLGIDNSSWGGEPALVEAVRYADLAEAVAASAELSDTEEYTAAIIALGTYGVSQPELDAAAQALAQADNDVQDSDPSPDTGAQGVAAVIGVAILAGAALVAARKR